jgi:hypothetical protein
MIAADLNVIEEDAAKPTAAKEFTPRIGLEQDHSKAGPDFAARSREFNMHFGFYRASVNQHTLITELAESLAWRFRRHSSDGLLVDTFLARDTANSVIRARFPGPCSRLERPGGIGPLIAMGPRVVVFHVASCPVQHDCVWVTVG